MILTKHRNECLPIVEVYWEDCMGGGRWRDPGECIKEWDTPHSMLHSSCGYLVKKTKNYVGIAISRSLTPDNANVSDTLQIPKGCVRSIEVIRKGK